MGQGLIPVLLARGHTVRAMVRPGSEQKLPSGAAAVIGNALDKASFAPRIQPSDTVVHLVGVPHPSPSKAAQFRAIDLEAARAAIAAAVESGIQHFVYVSVAHPAPAMKAFIRVRTECEEMLQASRLNATILRPWYVLGPGHRWPYALLPAYWLCERIPRTREGAVRLGLVTLDQMVNALVAAIERPCDGIRIVDVPQIRNSVLLASRRAG
jgi:uncharacterized protein YbjT (DUF2867 family)